MVVIVLVFAIIPQVVWKESKALVVVLSLLFPSSNFTYMIMAFASFESEEGKVNLTADIPRGDGDDSPVWRVPLYVHWVFFIVQIVVYPVLAYFLEQLLFSTASSCRKFVQPSSPHAPTVSLGNFAKT